MHPTSNRDGRPNYTFAHALANAHGLGVRANLLVSGGTRRAERPASLGNGSKARSPRLDGRASGLEQFFMFRLFSRDIPPRVPGSEEWQLWGPDGDAPMRRRAPRGAPVLP